MESTFADRFWWARTQRARLGSTRLARQIGCAQGLISHLERNNAHGSKYTKQFAKVFKVDAKWLEFGDDPQPEGFDAETARNGRLAMMQASEERRPDMAEIDGEKTVSIANYRKPQPRWTLNESAVTAPRPDSPAAVQGSLIQKFLAYAQLVGPERTKEFVKVLGHLADTIAFESTHGQDQIRS